MISLDVKLYASLRNCAPKHDWSQPMKVQLEDGATCGDLLAHFKVPYPRSVFAVVNGTRQKSDWELKDGDSVGLFPPVGGG